MHLDSIRDTLSHFRIQGTDIQDIQTTVAYLFYLLIKLHDDYFVGMIRFSYLVFYAYREYHVPLSL